MHDKTISEIKGIFLSIVIGNWNETFCDILENYDNLVDNYVMDYELMDNLRSDGSISITDDNTDIAYTFQLGKAKNGRYDWSFFPTDVISSNGTFIE